MIGTSYLCRDSTIHSILTRFRGIMDLGELEVRRGGPKGLYRRRKLVEVVGGGSNVFDIFMSQSLGERTSVGEIVSIIYIMYIIARE